MKEGSSPEGWMFSISESREPAEPEGQGEGALALAAAFPCHGEASIDAPGGGVCLEMPLGVQ